MKNIIIMLITCLLAFNAAAQNSETAKKPMDNDKVYRQAMRYLRGINTDVNYKEALVRLNYLAKQNDPRAINALAGMLRQGMGVPQNQAKAREFYQKASEMGLGKASFNLAQMYKTAQGGEQDLAKAFEYALKAEQQGDPKAIYLAGYMYYKGLGTKQDYAKAVEYFAKGTELKQPSNIYFLGLCYMNGNGVPKDIEKGKQLIEQAANLGNDHAVEFIARNFVGRYNKTKRLAKGAAGASNPVFRTKAGSTTLNLNGEWTGRILEYDWSKESIRTEQNLNLKITDEKGKLSGIWLQSDTVSIELNATKNGSVYETKNMQYMLTWDRTFQIQSLEFTMETDEKGDSILYAVITQFSPQTVEPSRPTMLEMRRAGSGLLSEAEAQNRSVSGVGLRVYPNPFTDNLTVEFTAQQAGEYSILLYDLSGKLIRVVGAKNLLPLQLQRETLNTASLPAGTYSVNLRGKGVNISTLVIKNKN